MTFWHTRANRRPTGGKLTTPWKVKKNHQVGSEATKTTVGEKKTRNDRNTGGNQKTRALRTNVVSVLDPKTGKTAKAEIKDVVENKANPHYVRMNVITKGAIIETSAGKARVTSRPGQTGSVSAVKVE